MLTLDTSPQLDLDVDSLEWVAMTLEIEQRFHVALTGEAASRILTLREVEAAAPASSGITTQQRIRYAERRAK